MLLNYAVRGNGWILGRWCARTSLALGMLVTMLPSMWYLGLVGVERWIARSPDTRLEESSLRVLDWPEMMIVSLGAAGLLCGLVACADRASRQWAALGLLPNAVAVVLVLALKPG